jgi:hypothetical protein
MPRGSYWVYGITKGGWFWGFIGVILLRLTCKIGKKTNELTIICEVKAINYI